ncbi:MAG: hypothetical protein ABI886_07675 [Betaproteobacteria bacterium]
MRSFAAAVLLCLASVTTSNAALAATPAQERQFVETYKKAFEGKDEKTLVGLLYTKGADPQALEFYKMMMTGDMSGKISSIQLLDLTADDKTRVQQMKGPDGKAAKLVLPPAKKLVIKSEKKDKNGSSSSSSEVYVAEFEGRLYIPVPAAAK